MAIPFDTVAIHQIFEGQDVPLQALEWLESPGKRGAFGCPLFGMHTIGKVEKSKASGRFDRLS